MAHHRHPDIDESSRNLCDLRSAFYFYSRSSAFLDESSGIAHRFLSTELVRQEWHIGDNQRALNAAAHGPGVMDHHVERDRQSGVESEHNHAEGVADENDIDAGTIEYPPHEHVVRCKNG